VRQRDERLRAADADASQMLTPFRETVRPACLPQRTDCDMRSCHLPATSSFSNAHRPNPGLFPPKAPRKRRQWWRELLKESAKLTATRTINKRTPRMVKRRNSPYASHDRTQPKKQTIDCTPHPLPPQPTAARFRFPKPGAG
jgi:hypothetical protein